MVPAATYVPEEIKDVVAVLFPLFKELLLKHQRTVFVNNVEYKYVNAVRSRLEEFGTVETCLTINPCPNSITVKVIFCERASASKVVEAGAQGAPLSSGVEAFWRVGASLDDCGFYPLGRLCQEAYADDARCKPLVKSVAPYLVSTMVDNYGAQYGLCAKRKQGAAIDSVFVSLLSPSAEDDSERSSRAAQRPPPPQQPQPPPPPTVKRLRKSKSGSSSDRQRTIGSWIAHFSKNNDSDRLFGLLREPDTSRDMDMINVSTAMSYLIEGEKRMTDLGAPYPSGLLLNEDAAYLGALVQDKLATWEPDARSVANFVISFGVADCEVDTHLVAALLEAASSLTEKNQFRSRDVVNFVCGWARLAGAGLTQPPSQQVVSRLCETYFGSVLDGTAYQHDIPFALHGFGSLSAAPSEHALESLVACLRPELRRFRGRSVHSELEATLGGLVWMGFRGDPAQQMLLELEQAWGPHFSGVTPLSVETWGVVGRPVPAALLAEAERFVLARKARAPFGLFRASGLAKCLYGLALARTDPSAALVSEVDAVLGDAEAVNRLRPRDLVNALWAVARHGLRPSEATVARLDEAVQAALPALSGAELASALWALACLDHTYVPANSSVRRLTEALCDRAESCAPVDLVNALWALAQLRGHWPSDEQVGTLSRLVLRHAGDLRLDHLITLQWAVATAGHELLPELAERLEAAVAATGSELGSRDAAIALWGVASGKRKRSPECVEALAQAVRRRIGDLSAHDEANVDWAFEKLGLA